jgi:uncharacterized protein YbjT (DUF2867 family)
VVVSKLGQYSTYTVRVMSRRPKPTVAQSTLEWAQANLETAAGLEAAVAGVQTVIHAATNPLWHTRQVDLDGTRRLLDVAHRAGASHLIYISIVGVDRIPFSYYQTKLATEELIANGGIPWTILRATQFHELLDLALRALLKLPVGLWFTDIPCQPIATDVVADALIQLVAAGPSNRLPGIGGPEMLSGSEILHTWLEVREMRRVVLPLYLPGKAAEGFRNGYHTCPDNRIGKITWREWVENKYGRSPRPEFNPRAARGH